MSASLALQTTLSRYEIGNGIEIQELVKHHWFESQSCDIDLMDMPPNAAMELHYHRTFNEVFFVVSGSGFRNSLGEKTPISVGDVFIARRGEAHAVTTGPEPMVVLTVCLPSFVNDDIHYLEP
jgi:mannose-6-phosphate isomerase-like protein (cupin superfamily)